MGRCHTLRAPSQETERAWGQAASTAVTFMKWPWRVASGATSPCTPHTLRVLSADPETSTLGGEGRQGGTSSPLPGTALL